MIEDTLKILGGSDFLKEEIRCGYRVTSKMKNIWLVELDLLVEFSRICKKYNLRYYADSGTTLGAIRHNGFIPWDDDIDVSMPREDYEEFIKVAPFELKKPISLQTPYTDNGYYYSFIKLRNENTTALVKAFKNAGFNQGIFLDIFPLDYCNPASFIQDREIISECIKKLSLHMKGIEVLSRPELLHYYETIQNTASNPAYFGSDKVATSVITMVSVERSIWDREWYSNYINVDFEHGISIPIPIGYDGYLSTLFGDYHQFPPLEERGNSHNGAIFDPHTPFSHYL